MATTFSGGTSAMTLCTWFHTYPPPGMKISSRRRTSSTCERRMPHSFSIVGTVTRVLVSEGTPVRKGQLLAEIDNTTVRNAYDMAQATLAQAEDAYKRLTPMHASGSLPDIKYVEAETGLRQARAGAAIARKSLDDCRLVATADGIVGKRSLDPGTVTVPNITSITIVKIAAVFARVSVPENEIARIRRGQTAEIRIGALGGREYSGTVEEIGVLADVLAHSYRIRITVPNPGGDIRPGMVCTANLRFPGQVRGLVIPNASLMVDEAGRNFVYRVGMRIGGSDFLTSFPAAMNTSAAGR